MIVWKTPEFLFLLVPLFISFYWFLFKIKNASLQVSKIVKLKSVKKTWRVRFIDTPKWLKGIAMILMIVALARPQKADDQVKKNVEGIDIIIALDISDSMAIEDMPPEENRLASAKKNVDQFIAGRVSDKIGLLVFSGESFTSVPPTLDYKILRERVLEIQSSRTIKMGTALGVALANSVARLKDSVAKSRIVVFMTDGENNSGTIDPLTALEIAKGYGIKIYSVGIGRDGETRLPIIQQDAFGNKVKRYQPFTSYVNDELLGKMAQETGGQYYRATSGHALEKIFKEIDKLEKTKIDERKYVKYSELFPPVLLMGVVLYLLAFILSKTLLRRAP